MRAHASGYRGLVVDFGGVLTSSLVEAMAAFSDSIGIELHELAQVALGAYAGVEDDLVLGFETGRIGETEFSEAFAQRLSRLAGRPVEADGLVARIFDVDLDEDMLSAVAEARNAGLETGLLSNSWGLAIYPMERLRPLFDAMVLSSEVGMRKPDPEIFRLVLHRLALDAGECIFVDDHPGHVEVARQEGFTAILHHSAASSIAELERLLGLSLSPAP